MPYYVVLYPIYKELYIWHKWDEQAATRIIDLQLKIEHNVFHIAEFGTVLYFPTNIMYSCYLAKHIKYRPL